MSAAPRLGLDPTRVLEEARRLARVHHAHVVTIYGADHVGDRVGIWMELIDGYTLAELVVNRRTAGGARGRVDRNGPLLGPCCGAPCGVGTQRPKDAQRDARSAWADRADGLWYQQGFDHGGRRARWNLDSRREPQRHDKSLAEHATKNILPATSLVRSGQTQGCTYEPG
jgi:hypothetical protein